MGSHSHRNANDSIIKKRIFPRYITTVTKLMNKLIEMKVRRRPKESELNVESSCYNIIDVCMFGCLHVRVFLHVWMSACLNVFTYLDNCIFECNTWFFGNISDAVPECRKPRVRVLASCKQEQLFQSYIGLETSRLFPEVFKKFSGGFESFHSKVSGKFPEKFGNSGEKN